MKTTAKICKMKPSLSAAVKRAGFCLNAISDQCESESKSHARHQASAIYVNALLNHVLDIVKYGHLSVDDLPAFNRIRSVSSKAKPV